VMSKKIGKRKEDYGYKTCYTLTAHRSDCKGKHQTLVSLIGLPNQLETVLNGFKPNFSNRASMEPENFTRFGFNTPKSLHFLGTKRVLGKSWWKNPTVNTTIDDKSPAIFGFQHFKVPVIRFNKHSSPIERFFEKETV